MRQVTPLLVDATNFDQLVDEICARVSKSELIGFDIEAHDHDRHEGLNKFRKIDDEGFAHEKKLVFDTRRTTVTGFSIYPDDTDAAFYINLGHSDVEKRVPWEKARRILDARRDTAMWVIHNAPYELVMMQNSLGYKVERFICTLQMAVSAYGPDEYSFDTFMAAGLGGMQKLIPSIMKTFAGFQRGQQMTPAQSEVFAQVVSKDSVAAHSYNGFVKEIAYGYGLKKAVMSWFGHQMTEYDEVLGGAPHMGAIPATQVVDYGCEDAVWCVRLYHRLLQYMLDTNPQVVETFFRQELPMVEVYAHVNREGMRINLDEVLKRRDQERINYAAAVRKLKASLKIFLPFKPAPHAKMLETEKWYFKNDSWRRYRQRIVDFCNSPDSPDPFLQAMQTRGAVSNAWADDREVAQSQAANFGHYMTTRTVFYDLMGLKPVYYKGKLQSDAETRGQFREEATPAHNAVLDALNEIASIEQRMKLYLTPYTLLTDPETGRIYPVYSSMLATRRMGTQFPNPMQLSKRTVEGMYIRGFYLADEDDHVIVSRDWSQIELVEIGDQSGDPVFRDHYGEIPYKDMHVVAAADAVDLSVDTFRQLPRMPDTVTELDTVIEGVVRKLVDKTGKALTPKDAYKYWRTELGKGSNFNYWYSGALSTVGEKVGWSSDEMWSRTEKYRERFAVAEKWRTDTITQAKFDGFVRLPDQHRRVRYEATFQWAQIMMDKWAVFSGNDPAVMAFAQEMVRSIQTRANNQNINALIQGSCATLAKRSIVRIMEAIRGHGLRARFMVSIHDELLFSVHRDDVLKFLKISGEIMSDHRDIIRTLPVISTAAIGRTFEPWHKTRAPFGQIELDEAPEIPGVIPPEKIGKALNETEIQAALDYLFREEQINAKVLEHAA